MWWDEALISATVTRPYVNNQLLPEEAARLDDKPGFGDGLTDDTYWEWIEQKAKRIFLILTELGVPDQIFGVIDDSWDDDDLPVPLDQVERLALTYEKNEKLEKKFFQKQFNYLVRPITKGVQLVYDDEEVIPLEIAEKRPVGPVASLIHSDVDKVQLPGKPNEVYSRRSIPFGEGKGSLTQEEYISGIERMKTVQHDHLTSLWASYVHQDVAYLLLTPANDTTLKSVLNLTPQSIKSLSKQDRQLLALNWIHCLANGLSSLHKQGLAHKNIKPSTVMLTSDNHIFLGDIGVFPLSEKHGFEKNSYDYCAPENAARPVTSMPGVVVSRGATARRPTAPSQPVRTSIHSTVPAVHSPSDRDTAPVHTILNGLHLSSSPPPLTPTTPAISDNQRIDIFALGAVFLEIITFFLKRSSKSFANHRGAKNKTAGRGGGLPDSSFHKNLGQVESWMDQLAKDASKKEDQIYRGVAHIISLIGQMISANPADRPTAAHVQTRIYTILNDYCCIGADANGLKSRIHCESRCVKKSEWNFGFEEARLASQRAAAEACAAVLTEARPLAVGHAHDLEKRDSSGRSSSADDDEYRLVAYSTTSSDGKSTPKSMRSGSTAKSRTKPTPWQPPVYADFGFR